MTQSTTTHSRCFAAAGSRFAALAFALAVLLGFGAQAQIADGEPYVAVVTTEGTLLRSNPTAAHYPVAKLRTGQVLRVMGQSGDWASVAYPAGVAAFAPADAVTINAEAGTATVVTPTQLKAVNMNTGLPGSWKPLLGEPLPAGTVLKLADPEPADDTRGGRAYRVVPPPGARAFVQASFLRRATPEEAAALQEPTPEAEEPEEPAAEPQPEAAPEEPAAQPPAGESLTEPMVPPGQPTPGERPAQPTPAPVERPAAPQPEQPTEAPTVIDQSGRPVVADAGAIRSRAATMEELEAAFEAVSKQPVEDAELGELMAEYQRTMAGLDDSPYNVRLKQRLQQRLDLLKIRADLQAALRQAAERRERLAQDQQRVSLRLAEVERARAYTIVGRLSASTLYDGVRLPLMFRIQSVGGAARTIGYIRPEPGMNLDQKLGQIVGVVGESAIDPSLRLNVINARRVDVLEPTGGADGGN